jgi:hypothetical protein
MWYLVLALAVYMPVLIGMLVYNHRHRQKYDEPMSHLKNHHPEIYEEISIKPVFGPLYSSGAYAASIRFARNHEPLDDPVAEELLSEYARISSVFRKPCLFVLGIVLFCAVVITLFFLIVFVYAAFLAIGK